jgi:hypothetical protein
MRFIRWMVVMLLGGLLLTGCLYSHVKIPYDTHLDKSAIGPKQGVASAYSVLWLVSWGDQGIAAAAKSGDIKTVTHMDQEIFSVVFGLYTKTSTIVYGH